MIFEQNLKNIIKICNEHEKCYSQILILSDFINSSYPLMDDLLLERFNKDNIDELGLNSDFKKIFDNILTSIISNNYDPLLFNRVDEAYDARINQIVLIFYSYISNKITIDDIKCTLYLTLFDIDINGFESLSMTAVLSICELYIRGVNITEFAGKGNYTLEFINQVARGDFKDTAYIQARGIVAATIDDCFNGDDLMELNFGNGSLIFEKTDENFVCVSSSFDLCTPIAVLNNDNEFLLGNYDVILNFCKNSLSNVTGYDGIDKIINSI